jgi:hypothetical protein
MTRRVIAAQTAAAAILLYSYTAFAHEFRPYLLGIRELGAGKYAVSWSGSGAPSEGAASTTPVFPAHCAVVEGGSPPRLLDCGAEGLAGSPIPITGLAEARVEAVVRYSGLDGSITTGVLRAGSATFTVPGAAGAPRPGAGIAADYLQAGVGHILKGWDHLLFVLGLLLLVKRARPLIQTITAFTLAHSLTLALAVTGAVRVPQAPAEALIALSLMLLAAELARPAPGASTLRQNPWVMAFVFGLLHGFGFAGALAELGLPEGEIPLALFAFNIGVELGQLAFVAAAVGVAWLARRSMSSADAIARRTHYVYLITNHFPRAPAYAIGALAAFWLLERLSKLGS